MPFAYKQGVESTFFPSRMKKYPSGLLTSIPAVDLSVIPSSMLMVMYKNRTKTKTKTKNEKHKNKNPKIVKIKWNEIA